ncbi:hypothetical protein STENM327S_03523 [Streptomyces tendae]
MCSSTGGGWPALATVMRCETGSYTAYRQVAMRSVPSRWACSSRWWSTSCGGRSTQARVCAVVRSCPMMAAEVMEWPMTSPTTSATRLPGSGMASYQSPPTRAVSAAGR